VSEWIEATQGAEPCPVCGFAQPDVMAAGSPARFFVECASTKCLVAGPSSATKETAVEKWNKMAARLSPAPPPTPTAAKRNPIRMLAVEFRDWSDELQRSVFNMRFVADDEARLDPDNGPRIKTGACPAPRKLYITEVDPRLRHCPGCACGKASEAAERKLEL